VSERDMEEDERGGLQSGGLKRDAGDHERVIRWSSDRWIGHTKCVSVLMPVLN